MLFLFGVAEDAGDGKARRWHLHTGDFRAHPQILQQHLTCADGSKMHVPDLVFDTIYLDTTYADPQYSFPLQDAVIEGVVRRVTGIVQEGRDPHGQGRLVPVRWLIAVGAYLIGKERVVLALAEALNCAIYADSRKRAILQRLQWPQLAARLTDDPHCTPLHIVSMAVLSSKRLADYLRAFKPFTHVLGIRPTGWSFSRVEPERKNRSETSRACGVTLKNASCPDLDISWHDSTVGLASVPYSEHSSYAELGQFLRGLSFLRVFPTVDNRHDTILHLAAFKHDPERLLAHWAASLAGRKTGWK